MALYDYGCPKCGHEFDVSIPMAEYEQRKVQACPECGTTAVRKISAVGVNYAGDDWPSKANRVRNQMYARRAEVGRRQKEHVGPAPVRLAPNVEGERVDNWREAQKLAKSKGKNTESYEPMIRKEQAVKEGKF